MYLPETQEEIFETRLNHYHLGDLDVRDVHIGPFLLIRVST